MMIKEDRSPEMENFSYNICQKDLIFIFNFFFAACKKYHVSVCCRFLEYFIWLFQSPYIIIACKAKDILVKKWFFYWFVMMLGLFFWTKISDNIYVSVYKNDIYYIYTMIRCNNFAKENLNK